MTIKTIVPKLGEPMHYLGKPVTNGCGSRVGSITEVIPVGDHYELIIDAPGLQSLPDRDIHSCSFGSLR